MKIRKTPLALVACLLLCGCVPDQEQAYGDSNPQLERIDQKTIGDIREITKDIQDSEGLAGMMELEAKKTYTSLKEAASQGEAEAQFQLGRLYKKGMGVDVNEEEAAYWYERAAEQEHPSAQYHLGQAYLSGQGVEKDEVRALEWLMSAASHGNEKAQYNIGFMYAKGKGVERDLNKALEWFNQAASGGDIESQLLLGSMYLKGVGVEKSATKSVSWYEQAAEKGAAEAMHELGLIYKTGEHEVSQSPVKSKEYFNKACEAGYEQSCELI